MALARLLFICVSTVEVVSPLACCFEPRPARMLDVGDVV